MRGAAELEVLSPQIGLWHSYEPSAKAELFSTALCTPAGVIVIDPIPLTPDGFGDLARLGHVSAIVVTNANHIRSAVQFTDRFSVPLFAHEESFQQDKPRRFQAVKDGDRILNALDVIALEGAAPGEIAVHASENRGTMVVGDALIHFEPYGFTFLPTKYCVEVAEMKRSLGKLLDYKFDRMLFAHGLPIASQAAGRLERLLGSENDTQ